MNVGPSTASFCGLRGVWPPRLTGWAGWTGVAVPMAIGIVRAVRAIRTAQPAARIVHVEAATDVHTTDPALDAHAAFYSRLGWLPTDLVFGRVGSTHPMWEWLLANGADPDDLTWLEANPAAVDLMGVNYYPDLSPRRLMVIDGETVQVAHDRGAAGLRDTLRRFDERYGVPLAITETSVEGDDARRHAWLDESVAEVHRLRAEGMDIRGYTWWPLFDFVDWSWAAGGVNVEEFAVARPAGDGSVRIGPAPPLGDPAEGKTPFLRRMGLVRLNESDGGRLDREPTAAADVYAAHAQGPVEEEDG